MTTTVGGKAGRDGSVQGEQSPVLRDILTQSAQPLTEERSESTHGNEASPSYLSSHNTPMANVWPRKARTAGRRRRTSMHALGYSSQQAMLSNEALNGKTSGLTRAPEASRSTSVKKQKRPTTGGKTYTGGQWASTPSSTIQPSERATVAGKTFTDTSPRQDRPAVGQKRYTGPGINRPQVSTLAPKQTTLPEHAFLG
jgi:hypothetical protein